VILAKDVLGHKGFFVMVFVIVVMIDGGCVCVC
jgi:hypothetical protein